jgi:hypothetical protein
VLTKGGKPISESKKKVAAVRQERGTDTTTEGLLISEISDRIHSMNVKLRTIGDLRFYTALKNVDDLTLTSHSMNSDLENIQCKLKGKGGQKKNESTKHTRTSVFELTTIGTGSMKSDEQQIRRRSTAMATMTKSQMIEIYKNIEDGIIPNSNDPALSYDELELREWITRTANAKLDEDQDIKQKLSVLSDKKAQDKQTKIEGDLMFAKKLPTYSPARQAEYHKSYAEGCHIAKFTLISNESAEAADDEVGEHDDVGLTAHDEPNASFQNESEHDAATTVESPLSSMRGDGDTSVRKTLNDVKHTKTVKIKRSRAVSSSDSEDDEVRAIIIGSI